MAVTLVGHNTFAGASEGPTGTIDSSGANLLLVHVSWYPVLTPTPSVFDSRSNFWTQLTPATNGNVRSCWWYSLPSSVGSAHTATAGGTSTFHAISFSAWSDTGFGPFLSENGSTASGTSSVQPGSVTPSENNCLVVCGVSYEDNSGGGRSIGSGFTKIDDIPYVGGVNEGGAIAYLVQSDATAVNPTWDITNVASVLASTIAVFKGPGGAGGGLPTGDSTGFWD